MRRPAIGRVVALAAVAGAAVAARELWRPLVRRSNTRVVRVRP